MKFSKLFLIPLLALSLAACNTTDQSGNGGNGDTGGEVTPVTAWTEAETALMKEHLNENVLPWFGIQGGTWAYSEEGGLTFTKTGEADALTADKTALITALTAAGYAKEEIDEPGVTLYALVTDEYYEAGVLVFIEMGADGKSMTITAEYDAGWEHGWDAELVEAFSDALLAQELITKPVKLPAIETGVNKMSLEPFPLFEDIPPLADYPSLATYLDAATYEATFKGFMTNLASKEYGYAIYENELSMYGLLSWHEANGEVDLLCSLIPTEDSASVVAYLSFLPEGMFPQVYHAPEAMMGKWIAETNAAGKPELCEIIIGDTEVLYDGMEDPLPITYADENSIEFELPVTAEEYITLYVKVDAEGVMTHGVVKLNEAGEKVYTPVTGPLLPCPAIPEQFQGKYVLTYIQATGEDTYADPVVVNAVIDETGMYINGKPVDYVRVENLGDAEYPEYYLLFNMGKTRFSMQVMGEYAFAMPHSSNPEAQDSIEMQRIKFAPSMIGIYEGTLETGTFDGKAEIKIEITADSVLVNGKPVDMITGIDSYSGGVNFIAGGKEYKLNNSAFGAMICLASEEESEAPTFYGTLQYTAVFAGFDESVVGTYNGTLTKGELTKTDNTKTTDVAIVITTEGLTLNGEPAEVVSYENWGAGFVINFKTEKNGELQLSLENGSYLFGKTEEEGATLDERTLYTDNIALAE